MMGFMNKQANLQGKRKLVFKINFRLAYVICLLAQVSTLMILYFLQKLLIEPRSRVRKRIKQGFFGTVPLFLLLALK